MIPSKSLTNGSKIKKRINEKLVAANKNEYDV